MVSVPDVIRHQPSFWWIEPSLSTILESARITPSSWIGTTHSWLLPNEVAVGEATSLGGQTQGPLDLAGAHERRKLGRATDLGPDPLRS